MVAQQLHEKVLELLPVDALSMEHSTKRKKEKKRKIHKGNKELITAFTKFTLDSPNFEVQTVLIWKEF